MAVTLCFGGMLVMQFLMEEDCGMNLSENAVFKNQKLLGIQVLPEKLFGQYTTECPFSPMSKKEILRELEMSRQQAEAGEYQEAEEFIAEIRNEYGI